MNVIFNQVRPLLFQIQLTDIPFTIEEIENEVNSLPMDRCDNSIKNRFRTYIPFGPITLYLSEFFKSNKLKEQLFDIYTTNPIMWNVIHPEGREKLFNMTHTGCTFNFDQPEFEMTCHIDNKGMFSTGMCFFNSEDDPSTSTYFYTDGAESNPLRMPTGFGVGWLSVNYDDAWHSGHNKSTKTRFNAMFGTMMNK
jgi:hypothetical protein